MRCSWRRRSLDAPRVHLLRAPWRVLLTEQGPREWRSSSNTNPSPSWTTLYQCAAGSGVIPLLAVILFMKGVVSTIGFVVILACGIGVLFFLNEQVERRSGIVTEVASGKLPKRPSKTVDHSVLEFREDPFGRATLLMSFVIMGLLVLDLSPLPTGRRGLGLRLDPLLLHLLFSSSCPAVFWVNLVRLRIEGDEVQVIYPLLGGWRNRAFRFGEIASVEVRERRQGGKEVCIGLHDGSSIRYMKWNETVIDELLEVLKRGVAQAKPAHAGLE